MPFYHSGIRELVRNETTNEVIDAGAVNWSKTTILWIMLPLGYCLCSCACCCAMCCCGFGATRNTVDEDVWGADGRRRLSARMSARMSVGWMSNLADTMSERSLGRNSTMHNMLSHRISRATAQFSQNLDFSLRQSQAIGSRFSSAGPRVSAAGGTRARISWAASARDSAARESTASMEEGGREGGVVPPVQWSPHSRAIISRDT
jgi:hypothetical protein